MPGMDEKRQLHVLKVSNSIKTKITLETVTKALIKNGHSVERAAKLANHFKAEFTVWQGLNMVVKYINSNEYLC